MPGSQHTPRSQLWPGAQTLPHAPQFDASLLVFVHVPGLLPQRSGRVCGHALQTPALQIAPVGHWWPQVPQLNGSLLLSTHVPLHRSGVGTSQLDTQLWLVGSQNVLVGQVIAFAHVDPHDVLLLRFVHTPPQLTWPVGQHRPLSLWVPAAQHLPASQVAPVPHCMPQPPQLSGSVWGLLHTPPQLLSPVGQHLSFVHDSPVAHESLQVEQLVFVPSVWHVPPQLAWPLAQQMPRSQVPVPQLLLHEPQLL